KEIGFIASENGAVVKYDPSIHAVQKAKPPAGPLTVHQRATLYFKAVRCVNSLLQEVGFKPIAEIGHSGFSLEMDNFLLEMVVKEPPNVAHVTSYPGYQYDPKKVTAKVEMMCPTDGKDYVIQVTSSTPKRGTALRFVVMRKDSPDLLKEAFMNALMTARDLISSDKALMDKIQAALGRRDIEKDYERIQSSDSAHSPSLPSSSGYQ
ncbi:MAG: hypothetical protein JZU63_03510, partial [Rhodoferax sp.]|nr:hypothetical protein [Rhodoferax sp.]